MNTCKTSVYLCPLCICTCTNAQRIGNMCRYIGIETIAIPVKPIRLGAMSYLINMKMNKLLLYFLLGWNITPFINFFEKYIYSDFDFLKFLFVICAVDTVIGIIKAFKTKTLSSRGFGMVFYKIIIYGSALIVSHVLVSFTVGLKANILFNWFDSAVFSTIIVKEAVSIFENIAIIDPDAFPKSVLRYLKSFDINFKRNKEIKEDEGNI